MKASPRPELNVALVHYPVINKRGEVIVSAITNLDLHDIARAVRTYNAGRFYVTTPLEDQARLAKRIIAYWTEGGGAAYNPRRADALERVRVETDLEAVREDIRRSGGKRPLTVATSARLHEKTVDFPFVRRLLTDQSVLLVFGTAWGLEATALAEADYVLEPLRGRDEYNHLSVRSAVSIMLDRLMRDDIE